MATDLRFPTSVTADAEIGLRLADDSDAQMISDWTQSPEVHRHWGGRVVSVEEVLAKYTGRRAPSVVSYVVTEHCHAVGYVQAWQQVGRCGLDMFISAEAQGRNIGPRVAQALARALTPLGWTPLTVDPAVDNVRAIRAWQAAGFVATGELGSDDGQPTQIMEYDSAVAGPRVSG